MPKRPPPSSRPYRRARAPILAAATHCGICTHTECPHCHGTKCGNRLDHLDHVTPRSQGGHDDPSINGQAAHKCCNLKKGANQAPDILHTSRPW